MIIAFVLCKKILTGTLVAQPKAGHAILRMIGASRALRILRVTSAMAAAARSYGICVSKWSMQLRRARFLSLPSTMYHGAWGMLVRAKVSSLALMQPWQRTRDCRSKGDSLHCFNGSCMAQGTASAALHGD